MGKDKLLDEYKKYKTALRGLCFDNRWHEATSFARDYFGWKVGACDEPESDRLTDERRLGNWGKIASIIEDWIYDRNTPGFSPSWTEEVEIAFYRAFGEKYKRYKK